MNEKVKSPIAKIETNVGTAERVISVITGSALMFSMLSKEKSLTKLTAAGYLIFRGITGYCLAYKAIGKSHLAGRNRNINIKTTLTVNKPRNEVYNFWRKLDNLPLFMKHLESVNTLDDNTSEWKAKIPGGLGTIAWKAEVVKDELNERIGWHSLPQSNIENAGNVHFRDAGKFGTEVHAVISYKVPVGMKGIGKLFNPLFEEMVREDIKNFRRYMETGEVPTIAGQPSGNSKPVLKG